MKKQISTNSSAKVQAPYSQAIEANGFVFVSGQISMTADGEIVSSSIEDQVHQVMKNLQNILEAAGLTFADVVKTEIFLQDMNDFAKMNEVYVSYMVEPYPARTTVQVARLPKDVGVEIAMTALKQQ